MAQPPSTRTRNKSSTEAASLRTKVGVPVPSSELAPAQQPSLKRRRSISNPEKEVPLASEGEAERPEKKPCLGLQADAPSFKGDERQLHSGPVSSSAILERLRAQNGVPPSSTSLVSPRSQVAPAPAAVSILEKNWMLNVLKERFPLKDPKALYIALQHYRFDLAAFDAAFAQGKVDFDALEKRYLLDEIVNVQNRLRELDELEKPLAPTKPVAPVATTATISAAIPKPASWKQSAPGHFSLEDVVLHSAEGVDVVTRFFRNEPRSRQVFTISRIERVENTLLYDRYKTSQAMVAVHNKGNFNEGTFFHGCHAEAIKSIAETGFDVRLADKKCVFGQGIYVAEYPRTSLSYVKGFLPSAMKIILCRVELGVPASMEDLFAYYPKASPADPIRRPPPRSKTDPRPFDSVQGLMRGDASHPIHVVYDSTQIYPEYVITFSLDKSRIVRLGEVPLASIPPTHPRYRAQLQETQKSIPFLRRSLDYAPNQGKPDHRFLGLLLRLLVEDPNDHKSIHHTQHFNLDKLQYFVRYYNTLCARLHLLALPANATDEVPDLPDVVLL